MDVVRVFFVLGLIYFFSVFNLVMGAVMLVRREKIMYSCGLTLAKVEHWSNNTIISCHLYELDVESDAAGIIRANGIPVKEVDLFTMQSVVRRCRDLKDYWTNKLPSVASNMSWTPIWNGIFPGVPGTKWCGPGDIADDYNDLGINAHIDICCRAHDLCPVKLKAFRSGYGLVNLSFYTKSHCDCDRDFRMCLLRNGDDMSNAIGNMYFNILRIPCLREADGKPCDDNSGAPERHKRDDQSEELEARCINSHRPSLQKFVSVSVQERYRPLSQPPTVAPSSTTPQTLIAPPSITTS